VSSPQVLAAAGADFRLADRVVRPALNRIEWPGGAAQVEPRVMDVLVLLARRAGAVVSKDELVREVWQGRFVTDDVVWRSIRELRRVLGDDARASSYIQTVARRGYRLLAPVAAPLVPPSPVPGPLPGVAPDPGVVLDPEVAPQPGIALHPRCRAPSASPPTPERLPAAVSAPAARRVLPALGAALAAALLVGALLALPRWRGEPAAPAPGLAGGRLRLAVLPFANLSGDPAQEYWADGLTEELISRLGSLQPDRLGVVGRTSVMAFKGRAADLREVGRQLGADYLLEGGVRREGGQVRVTARLVQAADRTVVWSDQQDLNLWGGLHLQSAVAARVASALEVRLLPAARTRLEAAAAPDPAAHDAYLRGRYLLAKGTPGEIRRAAAAFEQAVAAGPRSTASAPAYASLAETRYLLALFGEVAPGAAWPAASAAAERAVALDGGLPEGHAILGSILFRFGWRFAEAEAELRRALELNASSAPAHHDYAWLLLALGRPDEALAEMHRAQELEPLSWRAAADIGWVEYRAGRYAKAVADMRRLLDLEPSSLAARKCLERALFALGRPGEALAETRKTLAQESRIPAPAGQEPAPGNKNPAPGDQSLVRGSHDLSRASQDPACRARRSR